MTSPTDVIARIAASMARVKEEEARIAARAKAYTGPERRGRPRAAAATTAPAPQQPDQVAQETPP